jgi:hypothetical protein
MRSADVLGGCARLEQAITGGALELCRADPSGYHSLAGGTFQL